MTSTQSKPLRLPAPAKINLFLHITGQREDGYHNLQTIFQFLDCCDYLEFSPNQSGEINISPALAGVATEDNLIYKAARALQKISGCKLGADIKLEKILPMGGGIGGGSSNAATTLVGLNQLWQTNLNKDQLKHIAAQLGADVPIFVHGHSAWAEGIGEQLTDVELEEKVYLLLIPPVHVNTAKIFSNKELTRDSEIIKLGAVLEQGALETTRNDCEALVKKLFPEVDIALSWLDNHAPSRMTGTGACVFAAFENKDLANKVIGEIPENYTAIVCRSLNTSPLYSLTS